MFLKNLNTNNFKKENMSSTVKEGDKVRHKKFGVGIVTSINEEDSMTIAEIKFESYGMKRLIVSGTTLEVIG